MQDDDDDDEEWIDISEDSEEEISDEEINENESTADSDKATKSSTDKNEDETSTLSHSENNSSRNTCEVDNRGQKADKVPRKKNVLTKQQKKAQKLEKKAKHKSEKNEELTAERKTKACTISVGRLLTDKDFRKIDVALAKQDVTYVKRGVKRTRDQVEMVEGELVKLSAIENIYKKRKHDKDARQKSVKVRVNCYILNNNLKEGR